MMAGTSRRQQIEQMLADDPQDRFLRYSLAMELQKEGEHERSIELLRELMVDQPPYVVAFFMAAKQLAGLGRIAECAGCCGTGSNRPAAKGTGMRPAK